MADFTPARNNIQVEEVGYKAAVSEAVGGKIAGAINFINDYQNKQYYMGVTGGFSSLVTPYTDIGIQEIFERASEIVNVSIRFGDSGTSGTSEFDIQWAADGSGTWASIFSTTPKVTSAATDNGAFDINLESATPSGCTVPVLSKSTFAKGDKIRCNITSAAVAASSFVIVIRFRPI